MPKPTLVALAYSPWSEKARWALDHHGVGYREVEYVPMLGEPWLRVASRTFLSGRVTVPALLTPHGAVFDSLRIARHAERVGRGAPLFPREREGAIEEWNVRSEGMLQAARVKVIARTRESRDAQLEALPPFLPSSVRGSLRSVALMGAAFLARKYDAGAAGLDRSERELRAGLDALRAALADGRMYLLGDSFTYADLTMAVAVHSIRPPDERLAIGEATREVWTDRALCDAYPDLLAWRDHIYGRHRDERPASA